MLRVRIPLEIANSSSWRVVLRLAVCPAVRSARRKWETLPALLFFGCAWPKLGETVTFKTRSIDLNRSVLVPIIQLGHSLNTGQYLTVALSDRAR